MIRLLALAAAFLFSFSASFNAYAVDLNQIQKELGTTGVNGWIHAAVPAQGLYVFTYRNPQNFFDYIEMSLVSYDKSIMNQLAGFERNDQVLVKGAFLDNPSPQKHINVSSIQMVKHYVSGYPSDPYQHEARIPDDLLGKTSATFLVHAIGGDGHILVVEYEDAVVPVFVTNAALTQGLARNDVISLKYKFQALPNHPTHLNIDESQPSPLTVVDSIMAKNQKSATLEGALILFPQSPEIEFNVFAVEEQLPNGLKRQYTLVNMDDPTVFTQIRLALQKAWDQHPKDYVNGRNKLVSSRIRVKATGIINEVDPSQANAQLLLKSVNSIQIIE
jgi:hypothetical protein